MTHRVESVLAGLLALSLAGCATMTEQRTDTTAPVSYDLGAPEQLTVNLDGAQPMGRALSTPAFDESEFEFDHPEDPPEALRWECGFGLGRVAPAVQSSLGAVLTSGSLVEAALGIEYRQFILHLHEPTVVRSEVER